LNLKKNDESKKISPIQKKSNRQKITKMTTMAATTNDDTDEDKKIKSTKENIKKISRLHQITPTNESLKVLFEKGFTSAQEIQEDPSMRATELSEPDRRNLLQRRLRLPRKRRRRRQL
jgi:hypothetical protein